MKQHRWKPLQKEDTIEVIAPSWGSPKDCYERIGAFFEPYQLKAHVGGLFSRTEPYHSDSDECRQEALINAFHNEKSKVIWCMRGGYGAGRLVPTLYDMPKPTTPKLLVGFSDITALHLLVNQHYGWPSLHAPVLFQMMQQKVDRASQEAVMDVVLGRTNQLEYPLIPLNDHAKKRSKTHSSLIGGNLSLLQTSIGTPWQINAEHKTVFIEEIGERGYAMDRMLNHLTQANIFDKADAVIIGDVTEGDEMNGDNHCQYAITRFAQNIALPVFRVQHIGHDTVNYPLPLNTQIVIKGGGHASIACDVGVQQ